MINFFVCERNKRLLPTKKSAYLIAGDWDDYSYKTSFNLIYYDNNENAAQIGTVKIGYKNQGEGWTLEKIPRTFKILPDGWFSLGQDVDYYKNLMEKTPPEIKDQILASLFDVSNDEQLFEKIKNESVFLNSLTRGVSLSVIKGQYQRVLGGKALLTPFDFMYQEAGNNIDAEVDLSFSVTPASKPPTNIHVLIGRNGVGKTTILTNMIHALTRIGPNRRPEGQFFLNNKVLPRDYFSSIVSVSFSAFDPFTPPSSRVDRTTGPAYFYIGLKNAQTEKSKSDLKTKDELINDFISSFKSCISQPEKIARWKKAIQFLESDLNFQSMSLTENLNHDDSTAVSKIRDLSRFMSSGHSIVLSTMTQLIDTVEEKTLVLLDEPESHLHPPLLSAFTRALSELLHDRNGVAIIATHSPVVLQEVPRSCVWKLTRLRNQGRADRPEIETFGESVGSLTREVFGLEVQKSGFHTMLQQAVDMGGSFESILEEYQDQLGLEAQLSLQAIISGQSNKQR